MRLTTDLFAYCAERIPSWNTISISGYHIREAGSTAAQEIAFTLANGIAYCEAAIAAGLSPDDFGERLSFFFNAHNHFFQEVAKFRAARRLWAEIMRDRFGVTNPRAQALRFHAQTGGSTLTAQQPENNVVRVAVQALVGGLRRRPVAPHERLRRGARAPDRARGALALRTQQILMHEAGTTDTADPLGGAFFLEALTDELESRARRADRSASTSSAAPSPRSSRAGCRREIEEAAFRLAAEVEEGERVIVGVNRFQRATASRRAPPARPGDRAPPARAHRARPRRADTPRTQPALAEVRRVAETDEQPAARDARGVAGPLHDRRDLRRAARAVGDVRLPATVGHSSPAARRPPP